MTSLSENDQHNEINIDAKQCANENKQASADNDQSKAVTTVINESLKSNQQPEELDGNGQSTEPTAEIKENSMVNGSYHENTPRNNDSSIVNNDEEEQQQDQNQTTETTTNINEDENQLKQSFYPKVKYSTMPYQRPPYYTNNHPFGLGPYYYYPPTPPSLPSIEKPTPLMFIPTQQPSGSASPSPSPSSRDNPVSNSATVSPQNLPPRLRQTSTTENDSNSQVSSVAPQSLPPSTTTNGRRHRSILPRGSNNYYSTHLPPPLMATPPGVLYTYPPVVHQPGHIAYNIRTPDELELLAFQQQMMNMPPGQYFWPPHTALPPPGHPHFSPYPMNGSPPVYLYHNSPMTQSASSYLNPEAAEWVPSQTDTDSSSLSSTDNNNILIDDEINFPPLNSTATTTTAVNNTQTIINTKDHIEDYSEKSNSSTEVTATSLNTTNDNPLLLPDNFNISSQSNSKLESTSTLSSSQDDTNSPLPSSPTKITPITYSTIISQSSEGNKPSKNTTTNQKQQRQAPPQTTNHAPNQLPPRDRNTKQPNQRTQNTPTVSANGNARRRPPFNNTRNNTRNLLGSETNSFSRQQQQQQLSPSPPQITDDWIEVKSKKTKKFDRSTNDNSSEKLVFDEPIHKSVSPPLSLTSTGDNTTTTTTTLTSEDDFDEKDSRNLVIIMDDNVSNDYNQMIVDDVHSRLDNNERLLLIMRGCPGSGKSTLAESLNHGYDGLILSADDYFVDDKFNKYVFDASKLDEAHQYNCRRASDALKRNISPVIIDNTNTQAWEIKPYVAMGKDAGYDILLIEPQTPWRHKPRELFKRNRHNLPLQRIKEMLNRFDHHVTVESIIAQLPSTRKTNHFTPSKQENLNTDNEKIDPILTSKKFYDILDDSLILDDVRLCIDDMILFLTSTFYQTTLLTSALTSTTTTSTTSQSSTPLSVSFYDLSLISPTSPTSLSSTPSTPLSRFHRPLTRFPSTSTNPDHSFNTEQILRLPSTTFPRGIDNSALTPPLSVQSSLIAKKRRKNKNKQATNELVLNVNNNNNTHNSNHEEKISLQQQPAFKVFLPEDYSDFVVIDEQNDNDCINNVNPNFQSQMNTTRDHSSSIADSKARELNHPSIPTNYMTMQCSSNSFRCPTNYSDPPRLDHHSSSCSSTKLPVSASLSAPSGDNEFSTRVAFLHDECLQSNTGKKCSLLTLRELSLNILNQWNKEIISTDPLFNSQSILDLLDDRNDGDDDYDNTKHNTTDIELSISNPMNTLCSVVNPSKKLYRELPNNKGLFSSTDDNHGLLSPFDNPLSNDIYQALQRILSQSNQTKKPVIDNQIQKGSQKKHNNTSNQRSALFSSRQSSSGTTKNSISLFPQTTNATQQSKQACPIDRATERQFEELERHFPSLETALLHDLFRENDYSYELTFLCLSTILEENASVTKTTTESILKSYQNLRCAALRHVQDYQHLLRNARLGQDYGMAGIASFYLQRASEVTQVIDDAKQAVCKCLSRWRLVQFHQRQRLTLRGLHSEEALKLFQKIEQEINEGNGKTLPKSVDLIIDHSEHSTDGPEKIRSVILNYLQQQNYKYSEPNKDVISLQFTNAQN